MYLKIERGIGHWFAVHSHKSFLFSYLFITLLLSLFEFASQPALAFKMSDYKEKMEKYVLGYKLLKHLEPKHTYVHWEAPEQFPPVVLPAQVVSPNHPLLHSVQPLHIRQPVPAPVHVLPPGPAVAHAALPRPPAMILPSPTPAHVHIDRQDHGHIVVQGAPSGANGRVKCPYEVYRIKQL